MSLMRMRIVIPSTVGLSQEGRTNHDILPAVNSLSTYVDEYLHSYHVPVLHRIENARVATVLHET